MIHGLNASRSLRVRTRARLSNSWPVLCYERACCDALRIPRITLSFSICTQYPIRCRTALPRVLTGIRRAVFLTKEPATAQLTIRARRSLMTSSGSSSTSLSMQGKDQSCVCCLQRKASAPNPRIWHGRPDVPCDN